MCFLRGKSICLDMISSGVPKPPTSARFSCILVCRNRCWTADRLQHRCLDDPAAYPLCSQEPETINHLLLGCVFAREDWFLILSVWDRVSWMPSTDSKIQDWWSSLAVDSKERRDSQQAQLLSSVHFGGTEIRWFRWNPP